MRAQMKGIKQVNHVLMEEVRTKQVKCKGTLYNIANHDTGYMETFDSNAELVGTRRLRPNERQANIFSLRKTAANQ